VWWHHASRFRAAGLTLVTFGLAGLAVALPVAAFHAGNGRFNRLVGWSTILAFSVAAAGFALVVADRKRSSEVASAGALGEAADQLAARVLIEEGVQRARLLGTDIVSVTTANIEFDRADQLVEFEDASTGRRRDLRTVAEFYQQQEPQRLVILGEPGSGKTVLALELMVRMLEQRQGGVAVIEPVPVRLSLPVWNTSQPFTEWVTAQLVARYGLADQVASGLVASGRILPVLDGLDEMDAEDGPPARATAAVLQLNEYITGRAGRPLVITCRTSDYARIDASIRPATTIRIRPLNAEKIIDYLQREVRDQDGLAAWQAWDDLIRELGNSDDQRVLDLLQTPWRLVLAVTLYRDGGSPAALLPTPSERPLSPESSQQHTARASGILLDAFIPARTRLYGQDRYEPEQTRPWLANLAAYLHDRDKKGMSGSDIVLTQCWPIAGARRVRRWHAAIAASLTIIAITLIAVGRNGGVRRSGGNVHHYLTSFPDLPRSFLIPGLVLIFVLMFLPWWAVRLALVTHEQPVLVNIQQLRTRQGRKRFVGGLASGLVGGLVVGLVLGLVAGLAYGRAGGLVFGLVVGLVAGLVYGLVGGLAPSKNAAVSDPRDGLRSDLVVGLASGLAFGLVIGLAGGLASGLVGGLASALVGGVMGGLVVFSATSCRYLVAVSFAASDRLLPLRFARFLDWAYRAGILRISGNAYQFRHSELRDRLQFQQAE
jgi:hypothetical protein